MRIKLEESRPSLETMEIQAILTSVKKIGICDKLRNKRYDHKYPFDKTYQFLRNIL